MYKDILAPLFSEALTNIGAPQIEDIKFDTPKNPLHGDLACNIAMQIAKKMGENPKKIANDIIESIPNNVNISSMSVAGPGFINITLSPAFFAAAIQFLADKKEFLGKQNIGNGKTVNVEYVSANPTGLLHLGHARNACIGDTIANLYHWLGYAVTREYYFNNAGNQMNNLAKSVHARYCAIAIDPDFLFPEDGYHGEYIIDIAQMLFDKYGASIADPTPDNLDICRKAAEKWCFDSIETTLKRMNIVHDVFYNEDSLYQTGKIQDVIDDFARKGVSYSKDGALWLKLTQLGLDDDRVIVKSTGEPTYRLPDIAYHREKFLRGFDIIVDLFGADHIATVPDVLAGLKALGYDSSAIIVLIHQFVTLTENGKQVKMSKRSGKSYTLDELIDEVGADVVRFFMINRSINTHLEFDLGIAKEQNDKNPVFYLQYAHARICSIFAKALEAPVEMDETPDYTLLTHQKEINLIKELLNFESAIPAACFKGEPLTLAEQLKQIATAFHAFYHDCKIIGVEPKLSYARLALADTARTAIKNGLTILGINAPEKM